MKGARDSLPQGTWLRGRREASSGNGRRCGAERGFIFKMGDDVETQMERRRERGSYEIQENHRRRPRQRHPIASLRKAGCVSGPLCEGISSPHSAQIYLPAILPFGQSPPALWPPPTRHSSNGCPLYGVSPRLRNSSLDPSGPGSPARCPDLDPLRQAHTTTRLFVKAFLKGMHFCFAGGNRTSFNLLWSEI